ncbi:hypothetical protein D3C84_928310 [compost metagenome]
MFADDRRNWNTVTNRFADARDIRAQTFTQPCQAGIQPETHQNLVTNHQCTVFMSNVLHMFEVTRQWHDASSVGQHRLKDDRRDVIVFFE